MKNYLENILLNLRKAIPSIYALFCSLLVLRIYEFVSYSNNTQEEGTKISYLIGGTLIDLLLANLVVLVILLIQSIFFLRKIKNTILINILSLLLLFANYVLIQVFLITKEPLDEIVFHFTWNEIQTIAGTDSVDLIVYLEMILVIAAYFGLIYFVKKIKQTRINRYVAQLILCCSICFMSFIPYHSTKHIAVKLVSNKLSYFVSKSLIYF